MALLAPSAFRPDRRQILAGIGSLVAWAGMPRAAFAGVHRDPRFIVVILRGALDGLAFAPPVGDPDYAGLRQDLALGVAGNGGTLPLDNLFALNAALPALHRRFTDRQALIVHATATGYRGRSHFDGQDVLESGLPGVAAVKTGWLNRLAGILPQEGRVQPREALAVAPTVPLILQGPAPTLTWMPARMEPVISDTRDRLAALYAETDPALAMVLARGVEVDDLAGAMGDGDAAPAPGKRNRLAELAAGAGRLLAEPEGPRIAMLNYNGWDTHSREGADKGRLFQLLGQFDEALEALATPLAPVWSDTVVAVVTEFGRTARENGTDGTDHGTGTVALLIGGAVAGGRVVADWPGLSEKALYDGRDLAPTTDLRAVLKGVLRDHLGLSERQLTETVFPDSIGIRPLDGLIA